MVGGAAKLEHEDEAIRDLTDELVARGHQVRVIARPDREPEHPLTVDAVIEIDGQLWAVDHCLLSRPAQLPVAIRRAEKALLPGLTVIAERHGCVLLVSLIPQSGAKGGQWGEDYYAKALELAEATAADGSGLARGDDGLLVQARPSSQPGAALIPLLNLSGNPLLAGQIEEGLRDPLIKKLNGQLKVAKEMGYHTALLLDQMPRPAGKSYTVWSAGPTTIAGVVSEIIEPFRTVLDQVWLRPATNPALELSPRVHLLLA